MKKERKEKRGNRRSCCWRERKKERKESAQLSNESY
jgi:hypothetical protein